MTNKIKCYTYTRVSTIMQVDGYSLDAQKEKLKGYAKYQGWEIVREYTDEGKSGKSVEGRPAFKEMLEDIKRQDDGVSYVLVFKLSRFGRNAADILTTIQMMQDYGVNLVCVEDGIDSSKVSSKLLISVLSSVAEIERENISVQTMEGRRQKAREGLWNGGFAPYGYKLVNKELVIEEDEAETIRLIYDKYVHTTMGFNAIAKYLADNEIKKKIRQNGSLEYFSTGLITRLIDNPIYCGLMPYGRRGVEKILGTRNEYHIVSKDEYMLNEGKHEAIVSKEIWDMAQARRLKQKNKKEKIYSLDHEHILTGLIACPECGQHFYGNVARKKKDDGTVREFWYYACKHRYSFNGKKCTYRKQWKEALINDIVVDKIKTVIKSPTFQDRLANGLTKEIDVTELEKELDNYNKQIAQNEGAKIKLSQNLDSLDINLPNYNQIYQDMQNRLFKFYDEIARLENLKAGVIARIETVKSDKLKIEHIMKYLKCFDELYDNCSDFEKQKLLKALIEEIEIYPEKQPNGRIVKSITFNFPIFLQGEERQILDLDGNLNLETIALLSLKDVKKA